MLVGEIKLHISPPSVGKWDDSPCMQQLPHYAMDDGIQNHYMVTNSSAPCLKFGYHSYKRSLT